MTALEKMRHFVESYPGADSFRGYKVDYTDQIPSNGGIFPSGLVEIERVKDILGNVTALNQHNFGLYCVFAKPPGDDAAAAINADWVMGFQEWVQEQSITGQAPIFGDMPSSERIMAQNGVLYDADGEGQAIYNIQISVQFTKIFKEDNPWIL